MAVNQIPIAQVDLRSEAKDLGLGKIPGAWRKETDPNVVKTPWDDIKDVGLVGAVSKVKERKRNKIEREAAAKRRPRIRPGYRADGTPDGTLGLSDIAGRLSVHNNGRPPTDTEVMKLLIQCPTNGCGRVQEDDWETVLALWLTRHGGLPVTAGASSSSRANNISTAEGISEGDVDLVGLAPSIDNRHHHQQNVSSEGARDEQQPTEEEKPGCRCCIS